MFMATGGGARVGEIGDPWWKQQRRTRPLRFKDTAPLPPESVLWGFPRSPLSAVVVGTVLQLTSPPVFTRPPPAPRTPRGSAFCGGWLRCHSPWLRSGCDGLCQVHCQVHGVCRRATIPPPCGALPRCCARGVPPAARVASALPPLPGQPAMLHVLYSLRKGAILGDVPRCSAVRE